MLHDVAGQDLAADIVVVQQVAKAAPTPRQYNDQVEECTVYVSLSEVSTYSPPSEGFGSRFVSALSAGWQNFVDGLQQVIVALAGAWPVVVIAAAACAGFVVCKKKKK